MIRTKDYFFSAWSFFFRWPTSIKHEFLPSGILLGAFIQAACFYLFFFSIAALSVESMYAKAAAFVVLCFFTGCFHEDGLADSFDSLGVTIWGDSNEARNRAVAAMKDSRLGSFGVTALIVLWLTRYQVSFSQVSVTSIVAVILVTRAVSLYFGKAIFHRLGGLGGHKASGVLIEIPWGAASAFCALALLGGGALLLSAGIGALFSFFLLSMCVGVVGIFSWTMARRLNGVNGDIMGGSAMVGELVLFFVLLSAKHLA